MYFLELIKSPLYSKETKFNCMSYLQINLYIKMNCLRCFQYTINHLKMSHQENVFTRYFNIFIKISVEKLITTNKNQEL